MSVLRAMQFSSTTFNRPPPLELQSYGTPSSQIAISRKQRVCAGHYSSMLQQAPACKDKGIKELSSKRTLFASPSSSPSSPKLTQWTLPFVNILSVPGFAILMRRREGYPRSGQHYTSSMVQLISEKLIAFRLVLDTIQIGVLNNLKKQYVQSLSEGRRGFIALIVTIVCLACPTVIVTGDKAIHTSNNVALAQSIGQIRQAALFLERFGESASTKVLDKVMTVISGQTVRPTGTMVRALRDSLGQLHTCLNEILEMALVYYETLFTSNPLIRDVHDARDEVWSFVRPVVSEDMQIAIMRPFSLQELTDAVHGLDGTFCLGDDGLTCQFFM
ncbi:hypothetical protein L7F22_043220 [Adiantum nelumboides]|nr:hypothetical protein [Adiantum nelumboides]